MTLQVVYSVSAGVTSDLSSRVFMASERLGLPPFSITQNAEEGSVAHSTLVVDDPLGSLVLKGHRRVYFVETSAPAGAQVIGNTYVGPKEISRGDWRVGPLARTFSVSLQDANTLISRRLIVGSDGNRPAETDIQRLTWLRGTTEANEFNGPTTYINTSNAVAMDAVDYRGQSVTAILSDLSQASQKNWWIVYFESVGQFGLWYDHDFSETYDSTIRLSNDEADVDDSTTFAYYSTATLTQDPSRVYSGTLVDFQPASTESTSWVYEQDIDTGNEFVFRDVAYPSLNVKTATKARARARKYLAKSDDEDDVVKVTFVVPAASVNKLMHGMRIETKGTHWGFSSGNSYTSFSWSRCMTRTVTQLSSTHYRIDAELSPPPVPVTPYVLLRRSKLIMVVGVQVNDIYFVHTGDDTAPLMPKVGPMTYVEADPLSLISPLIDDKSGWIGVDFQASGTIEYNSHWIWETASAGYTVRVDVLLNGAVVASGSCVTTTGGCRFDIGTVGTPNTLSVAAGDQLRFQADKGQTGDGIYIDSVGYGFEITGGSLFE